MKKLQKKFYQRGEIATLLTLISMGLMVIGVAVGNVAVQQTTNTRSKAQETPSCLGTCLSSPDPQKTCSTNSFYCPVDYPNCCVDIPAQPPPPASSNESGKCYWIDDANQCHSIVAMADGSCPSSISDKPGSPLRPGPCPDEENKPSDKTQGQSCGTSGSCQLDSSCSVKDSGNTECDKNQGLVCCLRKAGTKTEGDDCGDGGKCSLSSVCSQENQIEGGNECAGDTLVCCKKSSTSPVGYLCGNKNGKECRSKPDGGRNFCFNEAVEGKKNICRDVFCEERNGWQNGEETQCQTSPEATKSECENGGGNCVRRACKEDQGETEKILSCEKSGIAESEKYSCCAPKTASDECSQKTDMNSCIAIEGCVWDVPLPNGISKCMKTKTARAKDECLDNTKDNPQANCDDTSNIACKPGNVWYKCIEGGVCPYDNKVGIGWPYWCGASGKISYNMNTAGECTWACQGPNQPAPKTDPRCLSDEGRDTKLDNGTVINPCLKMQCAPDPNRNNKTFWIKIEEACQNGAVYEKPGAFTDIPCEISAKTEVFADCGGTEKNPPKPTVVEDKRIPGGKGSPKNEPAKKGEDKGATLTVDKSQYTIGESIKFCFTVPNSKPARVKFTVSLDDGKTLSPQETDDDGKGDCLTGKASEPIGGRRLQMTVTDSGKVIAQPEVKYQVVAKNQSTGSNSSCRLPRTSLSTGCSACILGKDDWAASRGDWAPAPGNQKKGLREDMNQYDVSRVGKECTDHDIVEYWCSGRDGTENKEAEKIRCQTKYKNVPESDKNQNAKGGCKESCSGESNPSECKIVKSCPGNPQLEIGQKDGKYYGKTDCSDGDKEKDNACATAEEYRKDCQVIKGGCSEDTNLEIGQSRNNPDRYFSKTDCSIGYTNKNTACSDAKGRKNSAVTNDANEIWQKVIDEYSSLDGATQVYNFITFIKSRPRAHIPTVQTIHCDPTKGSYVNGGCDTEYKN